MRLFVDISRFSRFFTKDLSSLITRRSLVQILPPQPKRKETPYASLFVLLMENLHQRPPEEVVGSSGAAPPGADAAAALDPQPRHWRAAAHKPGPGMAVRQGGSNPSPATKMKRDALCVSFRFAYGELASTASGGGRWIERGCAAGDVLGRLTSERFHLPYAHPDSG